MYTYCLQSPGHLFFIIITYLVITQNIPSSVSYKHDPTNPYLILLEWITGHNNPFPPTVTQIMTTSYILAYTEASFLLFRISYRKISFHTNWINIYIYIWINYQLDAIEYLFVYFQLDMFQAYTPIFRRNGCYIIFTYAAYGVLGVARCRSWGMCVLVACCTVALQHATSTHTPQDWHLTTPRYVHHLHFLFHF